MLISDVVQLLCSHSLRLELDKCPRANNLVFQVELLDSKNCEESTELLGGTLKASGIGVWGLLMSFDSEVRQTCRWCAASTRSGPLCFRRRLSAAHWRSSPCPWPTTASRCFQAEICTLSDRLGLHSYRYAVVQLTSYTPLVPSAPMTELLNHRAIPVGLSSESFMALLSLLWCCSWPTRSTSFV